MAGPRDFTGRDGAVRASRLQVGRAEFGGVAEVTVTLADKFPDTDYRVAVTQQADPGSAMGPWVNTKTTTTFKITYDAAFTGMVEWIAIHEDA